MDKSEINEELLQHLRKLNEKYESMGQDLSSYLDGLLHADYLSYWDYIHLDTLLSLQSPRTSFPDEKIFIISHQIPELYFQLILHELEQIRTEVKTVEKFILKLKRVISYFKHLVDSFEIMQGGMEREQFMQFRMSLMPASGFQSVQYRKIEICSTDAVNLINIDKRSETDPYLPEDQLYADLYWKNGATELATGKKTLTLNQFDEAYRLPLIELMKDCRSNNVWRAYEKHFQSKDQEKQLIPLLKEYDALANVYWPLAHYKSAVRYLQNDENIISATGGTNWQKYLPPRFQKVQFFPLLWTPEEQEEWGKGWVMKEVFNKTE
ncbi:MAG: tryptophan 2,3-dioxygenase family protein [Cyclobacteriaceae bacterium]